MVGDRGGGKGAEQVGLLRAPQRVVVLRVIRGLARVPPLALLACMYSAKYHRRVALLREGLEENDLREALADSERQTR